MRESPSTLGYMASDIQTMKMINTFMVMPHLGLSDHCSLCVTINTNFSCTKENAASKIHTKSSSKYVSNSIFLMKLRSPIGKEKLNFFLCKHGNSNSKSVDILYADLLDIVNSLAAVNSGSQSRRKKSNKKRDEKNHKPSWYKSECRVSKTALNRAEKNYKKHPFDRNRLQILIASRKQFKKACRESEQNFRNMLTKQLFTIEKQNPNEFWNLIKKMRKWGKPNDDPSESIQPNEWLSHFQVLLNNGKETPSVLLKELEHVEKIPTFSELDSRISIRDIEKALKRLKQKAAPGPDKISAELLHSGKIFLMPLLVIILNSSHTCNFSTVMDSKLPQTIFKKGESFDPNNYRGIAVGSAMGKLFSLVVLERLEKRIQETHPLSENQIGFRKGYRTADHVFVINTIVSKVVKAEKETVLCFR